jgi:hypothetical protein
MNAPHHPRRARALIALVWLACGLMLLLTPLAWPNRVFGFTSVFWLVGAPACVLLALQPRLATRLLVPARSRRRPR